jgi:hypothetical protein
VKAEPVHRQREQFALLVRRAGADGRFTEPEHLKLDRARFLIGMPDAEAEPIVRQVVAAAEEFFGQKVEGG